ncbi:hypothetical protein CS8_011750 [Cupriavidus sp. 8B]
MRADGTQIEVRDFPASYAAAIASMHGQYNAKRLSGSLGLETCATSLNLRGDAVSLSLQSRA